MNTIIWLVADYFYSIGLFEMLHIEVLPMKEIEVYTSAYKTNAFKARFHKTQKYIVHRLLCFLLRVVCDCLILLAAIFNAYYHLADGAYDQLNANMAAAGEDFYNNLQLQYS